MRCTGSLSRVPKEDGDDNGGVVEAVATEAAAAAV